MAKHLSIAIAAAAIIATQVTVYLASRERAEPIVRAEWVEVIHVDAHAQTMNVTVGAEGQPRTTIAFTPSAALQAQQEMARMVLLTVEAGEALRAQQLSTAPSP